MNMMKASAIEYIKLVILFLGVCAFRLLKTMPRIAGVSPNKKVYTNIICTNRYALSESIVSPRRRPISTIRNTLRINPKL